MSYIIPKCILPKLGMCSPLLFIYTQHYHSQQPSPSIIWPDKWINRKQHLIKHFAVTRRANLQIDPEHPKRIVCTGRLMCHSSEVFGIIELTWDSFGVFACIERRGRSELADGANTMVQRFKVCGWSKADGQGVLGGLWISVVRVYSMWNLCHRNVYLQSFPFNSLSLSLSLDQRKHCRSVIFANP